MRAPRGALGIHRYSREENHMKIKSKVRAGRDCGGGKI
jgi:hypothetical protein